VDNKEVCKCSKASVEFIAVEEDRWTAKLENANVKRSKCEVKYTCKSCGEVFANADSAMMED
jgi:hypothetical protein